MREWCAEDFDYPLPENLIAAVPAERRDASRLLVMPKDAKQDMQHRTFRDLPEFLRPGDVLVLNDSRVIRARLQGHRDSGGAVEVLLLQPEAGGLWSALVRPSKRLPEGSRIAFAGGALVMEMLGARDGGERVVRLLHDGPLESLLARAGELPLPPYIVKRRKDLGGEAALPLDEERYQTVYARHDGSVAAPTAGLHFTTEMLEQLTAQGVEIARVTLHVGAGTFKPMNDGPVHAHPMHEESYHIPDNAAQLVSRARRAGRRIVAVGTTATRALESAMGDDGMMKPGLGRTRLMISPGYRFRAVDALITNFHLPRSTLLLLVSAMTGRERLLEAYAEAIRREYRFFSYGDAMFVEGACAASG